MESSCEKVLKWCESQYGQLLGRYCFNLSGSAFSFNRSVKFTFGVNHKSAYFETLCCFKSINAALYSIPGVCTVVIHFSVAFL